MSSKLKDYQSQLHLPDSDFQNLYMPDPNAINDPNYYNSDLSGLLSSHILSPLFLEYESSLRHLERDLKNRNLETARQAVDIQMLL